jgi:homoserine kinase type II
LDFIVALRFAWLSEWLRKSDKEMIELEQVYMRLLIENKEQLVHSWGLQ